MLSYWSPFWQHQVAYTYVNIECTGRHSAYHYTQYNVWSLLYCVLLRGTFKQHIPVYCVGLLHIFNHVSFLLELV